MVQSKLRISEPDWLALLFANVIPIVLCALIVFVILQQTDILTHMMFLFNRLFKPIQNQRKKSKWKKNRR